MTETPNWMQDDAIKDISPEKLEFLRELVEGGQGKSQKEMMMFVMRSMKNAKAKGLTFQPAELQVLMDTVRKYSSPEDLAKVDELLNQHKPNNSI
ncbi:MAG: hypothetical protein IJY10_01055 [Lachnospiraceae bacterium]|nr:hypothetical protein [Lachnospiraceae bacterium]MBQ9122061.1 hypothetical protein [Lachnospiraceae bacterium]